MSERHSTQRRTRWRHNLADVGAKKWTWATTTWKVWASGPADADAGRTISEGCGRGWGSPDACADLWSLLPLRIWILFFKEGDSTIV